MKIKSIEYENREFSFEIDSYEDKILNNNNNIVLKGNWYYLKSKENVIELKKEIENLFKENNIEYEIKEIQNDNINIMEDKNEIKK